MGGVQRAVQVVAKSGVMLEAAPAPQNSGHLPVPAPALRDRVVWGYTTVGAWGAQLLYQGLDHRPTIQLP
jgi:hypothetical protein